MRDGGNGFVLADVSAEVMAELRATGVLAIVGADYVIAATTEPDASLDQAAAAVTRARRADA